MLDPLQVDGYLDAIRRVYADAETAMLDKVARRLARGIDEPGWAERKLAEIHAFNEEIGNVLVDLRLQTESVTAVIQQAYDDGVADAVAELRAAHLAETGAAASMAAASATRTLINATVSAIEGTHLRILRTAQDIYRNVIADASAQVLIGTETRRTACQVALNNFADRGVTGFIDTAGRRWDLGSYTETCIRTATSHASVQGHLDKLGAEGYDLVKVSRHGSCCEMCGPWEGAVLSQSGQTEGYRTVAQATAAGLLHPNCRHRFGLYVPGLTRDGNDGVDYNPEQYKAEQRQRVIERQIRRWKKREVVALGDEARQQARAKVRQWQAAQREHVAEFDLRRKYEREQIRAAG